MTQEDRRWCDCRCNTWPSYCKHLSFMHFWWFIKNENWLSNFRL